MTEPRTQSTQLPLDILGYIVDIYADGNDMDTLKILSQTCKFLLPLCRKHLFSTLNLHGDQCDRFSDLFSRCSELVRYVKILSYEVAKHVPDHDLKIIDLLRNHSPSLQSIELLSHQRLDWNQIPESMQSSLVLLIQLPTITRLDICRVKGFPATALALCSNLIDLRIGQLDIAPPDAGRNITRSKISTPASLYINISDDALTVLMASVDPRTVSPIIDFSCLQRASFVLESPDNIAQIRQLIQTSAQIQYLSIDLDWPVMLAGIGQSLNVNAYRTLTILSVDIKAVRGDRDTLCGLNHELRFIAKNNILEELTLDVEVVTRASPNTDSEDWSAFDSVLTDSGAFPMLHRVSVTIWWYLFQVGVVNNSDFFIHSKKRFARLVSSASVEFKFCLWVDIY